MTDTSSIEAEALQQRMQQVRTSLSVEMRELAVNARAMTDWRHYWRKHPGLCSAGAAVLGYLLVPACRLAQADVKRVTEDVARSHMRMPVGSPSPGLGKRLFGELAGLALGFAVKRGLQVLEEKLTAAESGATPAPATPPVSERMKPKRKSL